MKLYSLRRGFLHRVHCRRLSPLSTRMRSLRRELLFGRCANETSSWIRPLVLQPTMLDLGSVRAGKRSLLASTSPADGRILTQRRRLGENSSDAVPAATYLHLCRAVDVLEGERARFSGDAHARHEQESQSARVLQCFAARLPSALPQLLSTLTDEFAFRRISRIDVRVL